MKIELGLILLVLVVSFTINYSKKSAENQSAEPAEKIQETSSNYQLEVAEVHNLENKKEIK